MLRLLLLLLRKILPGDKLLRLRLMEEVDGNMHLFCLSGRGWAAGGLEGVRWV